VAAFVIFAGFLNVKLLEEEAESESYDLRDLFLAVVLGFGWDLETDFVAVLDWDLEVDLV